MDLSIGDRVFYILSNGLLPPATAVETAEDGLLHLEYYQDRLRVVNGQCKMKYTLRSRVGIRHLTFLHLHRPTHRQAPPPPPPQRPLVFHHCYKNREGPPQGPLQFNLARLIPWVFERGVPRGSSGEQSLKGARSARIPPKALTGRGLVRPHDSPCYPAFGNTFKHKKSLGLVTIGARLQKKIPLPEPPNVHRILLDCRVYGFSRCIQDCQDCLKIGRSGV